MTKPIPGWIVMTRKIGKQEFALPLKDIANRLGLFDVAVLEKIKVTGGVVTLPTAKRVVMYFFMGKDLETYTYLMIHGDTGWFTND